MRTRLLVAALPALLAGRALAFDPAKASRYPSPDLFRPNVDSIILRGSGSTGSVDSMTVTPDPTAPDNTLSRRFGDLAGLKAPGPTGYASLDAAYLTVNSRALFHAPPSGPASNWLGNGAGGSAAQYAYGGFGQVVALSGIGDVGLVGATRTTDAVVDGRMAIGTMGWAFNFNTTRAAPAWAGYLEARRVTGAGPAQSLEVNVTELGSTDVTTPSAKGSGANAVYTFTSHGVAIASGGNCTEAAGKCWDGTKLATAVDASVALPIYNNGAQFKKGIIVGDNAITGCDGTGGAATCSAIELGRGSMLTFIDGSTRQGAQIYSDVSPAGNGLRQRFTDYGTTFDGYGYPTLNIVSKSTDVNGVQIWGSKNAGEPTRIMAAGSPNASIALTASGTGSVQVQSALQIAVSGSGNRALCVNGQNIVYAAASCQ